MKRFIPLFVAMLLLVVAAGAVLAQQEVNNSWVKFADDQYLYVGTLGGEPIFLRQESQQDFKKVADTMEATLFAEKGKGRHEALPQVAVKALSNGNEPKDVVSNAFSLNYQVTLPRDLEPQHTIFLREIVHNNNKLYIAEPESGSAVVLADPTKKKYLFADENLWLFDAETKQLKQLTLDKSGKFDRLTMVPEVRAKDEDFFVHWAHRPYWNTTGTMVSYESNRDKLFTSGMDIWTINLATGEEKQVVQSQSGLETLGWISDTEIVYEQGTRVNGYERFDVKVVDVQTGQTRTLVSDVRFMGMGNGKVVYAKETGAPAVEVYCIDLSGRNGRLIAKARNNYMFDCYAGFTPDGQKVVLTSRNQQGKQLITVVDLTTMVSKDLEGPWGHMLMSNPIWLDSYRLLVQSQPDTPDNANRTSTWVYQF